VLIVDDNATAREVLAAMVTSFGWQAETATGGAEAIQRLEAATAAGQSFDILCVDWIMPGMDGWETIQHIRALNAGRLPAILMITAHGRELIAERLGEATNPLDGFLVKPVTPSMLFDAVAQATHGASVTWIVVPRQACRPASRLPACASSWSRTICSTSKSHVNFLPMPGPRSRWPAMVSRVSSASVVPWCLTARS